MVYKDHKQFRLPGYDYSLNGYYFVTICTHNRVNYFGEILLENGGAPSMALSAIGKIVVDCWRKIPVWCNYVKLDVFQIMPNHFHGIIIIQNDERVSSGDSRPRRNVADFPEENLLRSYNDTDNNPGVENQIDENTPSNYFSAISPKSQSLGAIIRSFKSRVVKQCKNKNLDFIWQPRFHDHIIRTEQELKNIRYYISNNVNNWKKDRNRL